MLCAEISSGLESGSGVGPRTVQFDLRRGPDELCITFPDSSLVVIGTPESFCILSGRGGSSGSSRQGPLHHRTLFSAHNKGLRIDTLAVDQRTQASVIRPKTRWLHEVHHSKLLVGLCSFSAMARRLDCDRRGPSRIGRASARPGAPAQRRGGLSASGGQLPLLEVRLGARPRSQPSPTPRPRSARCTPPTDCWTPAPSESRRRFTERGWPPTCACRDRPGGRRWWS